MKRQKILEFNKELENGDEFRRIGFLRKFPNIYHGNIKVGVIENFVEIGNELFVDFTIEKEFEKEFENKNLSIAPDFEIKVSFNKRKSTWSDIDLRGGKEFKRKEGDTFVFLMYTINKFVITETPLIK
ncbi:MAG: hypothetical protein IKJ72_03025 [Mycoplasmataceae bacterium]|nr:hypothetical protein [Mycoplasmataceae bacterium]